MLKRLKRLKSLRLWNARNARNLDALETSEARGENKTKTKKNYYISAALRASRAKKVWWVMEFSAAVSEINIFAKIGVYFKFHIF